MCALSPRVNLPRLSRGNIGHSVFAGIQSMLPYPLYYVMCPHNTREGVVIIETATLKSCRENQNVWTNQIQELNNVKIVYVDTLYCITHVILTHSAFKELLYWSAS